MGFIFEPVRDPTADARLRRLSQGLTALIAGAKQGELAFRNSRGLTMLPTSTAGYVLKTQGAGADPVWAEANVDGNLLINGEGTFFQRQDPAAATARADDAYAGDRWYVLTQTASINSQRSTGNLAKYAHKLTQNQAAAQRLGYASIVEHQDSYALRSQTVRFAGKCKISASQAVRFAILEWTGTADSVTSDVVNDWTSASYTAGNFFLAANLTVTAVGTITPAAATWTSFALTGTVSATCNNLIVIFWTEGTAAQNVTLELTEMQLTRGALAVSYAPRLQTDELLLCQRYYCKSYAIDTNPGTVTNTGCIAYVTASTAGEWGPNVFYPVEMRTTPTKTFYSTNSGASGNKYNATDAVDVAMTTTNVAGNRSHGGSSNHVSAKVYRYQFTADAEL